MEVTANDDRELVEKFLSGCTTSYDELVNRFERSIYNTASCLTKSEEDAEYVLEQVFVALYEKMGTAGSAESLTKWLYRHTLDTALATLVEGAERTALTVEKVAVAYENVSEEVLVDKKKSTDVSVLCEALRMLPEEYKAVFLLKDMQGLSVEEAADVLDISVFEVRGRLHRGRLMVHRQLKKLDRCQEEEKILAPEVEGVQPSLLT
jgi:RNA polymerase sigma-70 factor (ECF subfamily)